MLPIPRGEITRFPHGVLEVKLSLPEGQKAPEWVQDLLDSGYLTEARARPATHHPRTYTQSPMLNATAVRWNNHYVCFSPMAWRFACIGVLAAPEALHSNLDTKAA